MMAGMCVSMYLFRTTVTAHSSNVSSLSLTHYKWTKLAENILPAAHIVNYITGFDIKLSPTGCFLGFFQTWPNVLPKLWCNRKYINAGKKTVFMGSIMYWFYYNLHTGLDSFAGCCFWLFFLWTDCLVRSSCEWMRSIELLWDLSRHCGPDGKRWSSSQIYSRSEIVLT